MGVLHCGSYPPPPRNIYHIVKAPLLQILNVSIRMEYLLHGKLCSSLDAVSKSLISFHAHFLLSSMKINELDGTGQFPGMNINDNRVHGITLDSKYIDLHDLDNIDNEFKNCTYFALHINIHVHGLASKFDQLTNLIHELRNSNIKVHFILLCETFLTEANAELFPLPGYNFSHKCRKSRAKGGIALYISDEFTFIERSDLSINIEGEFEKYHY